MLPACCIETERRMGNKFGSWARSRRGACAIACSLGLAASGVSNGSVTPAEVIPLGIVAVPLMSVLVWIAAVIWEDKTRPKAPRFAREAAPSASRQLREDPNAGIYTDR